MTPLLATRYADLLEVMAGPTLEHVWPRFLTRF
jgi:hypothetical protein